MINGLRAIAVRPFDGKMREGTRQGYLFQQLRKMGCKPEMDRYGNIWVEKRSALGKRGKTTLFSSHIDVDHHIHRIRFRSQRDGNKTILSGVMDNAVGCYLNLMLACRAPKKGHAIYVFTASEEMEKNRPRRFAKSAREVVRQLRQRKKKPDLCVAIDVTYPRLLRPQEKIKWHKKAEELFDMQDRTHCYLDGYSRRDARKIGISYVRSYNNPKVATRRFHGHDEAHIYAAIAPSFAFGPVVYGHFDKPDQRMPLAHMKTALGFLRYIRDL